MQTGAPRAIELVIFDCDGVLVDSERLAVRVDVRVLAALGWALSEREVIERFVGRSPACMVAEIEAHLGRRLADDWEDAFQPLYREAFAAELAPVEGVVEALDQIALATCVASSGTHEKMRYTLGLTGLYDRFAGRIFSATDVARGKPAPDLFLHAAKKMGVDPARCAVDEALCSIPIVMLTTTDREEEVMATYRAGANSFVTKPVKFAEFADRVASLRQYWTHTSQLPAA
jgi:HAD superfamily hydrolase (TIGR01509 family)